ncbi:hypothetical protein PCE1_004624 [Barthelona sp. PCE]
MSTSQGQSTRGSRRRRRRKNNGRGTATPVGSSTVSALTQLQTVPELGQSQELELETPKGVNKSQDLELTTPAMKSENEEQRGSEVAPNLDRSVLLMTHPIFTPKVKQIFLEEKVIDVPKQLFRKESDEYQEFLRRDKALEGLTVMQHFPVLKSNLSFMEHRLRSSTQFFDLSGRLQRVNYDLFHHMMLRSKYSQAQPDDLKLKRRRVIYRSGLESAKSGTNISLHYALNTINLTSHTMLDEEKILGVRVAKLVNDLKHVESLALARAYYERITEVETQLGLRGELDMAQLSIEELIRLQDGLLSVLCVYDSLAEAEHRTVSIRSEIAQLWARMKTCVMEKGGENSSPVNVKFHPSKSIDVPLNKDIVQDYEERLILLNTLEEYVARRLEKKEYLPRDVTLLTKTFGDRISFIRKTRAALRNATARLGPEVEIKHVPPQEQQLSRYRYFVRVVVDAREVCCSSSQMLQEDGSLVFNERLVVTFFVLPKQMNLELRRKRMPLLPFSDLIASIPVQIPGVSSLALRSFYPVTIETSFNSETTNSEVVIDLEPPAAAAETTQEEATVAEPAIERIEGVVNTTIGWSRADLPHPMRTEFLPPQMNAFKVDPLDPRSAALQVPKASEIPASILEKINPVFATSNPDPMRLRALNMRASGRLPSDFVVPLDGANLSEAVLADDVDVTQSKSKTHKAKVSSFLQRIRSSRMARALLDRRTIQYSDIVSEPPAPESEGSFLDVLARFFSSNRPLYPEAEIVTAMSSDKPRLVVQVIRSNNIPTRDFRESGSSISKPVRSDGISQDIRSVVPFIEVSFQGSTRKTSTAVGSGVSWFSTLELEFDEETLGKGRVTPLVLSQLESTIDFNLFDLQIFRNQQDDREENTINVRYEKRWLGKVSIPFNIVHESGGHLEATIPVSRPEFLLGFNVPKEVTTLTFVITVHPTLPALPETFSLKYTAENAELTTKAAKFMERYLLGRGSSFRNARVLVSDLNGAGTFICRYLRPLKPPQNFLSMHSAFRFVCMIPYIADSVSFVGHEEVWMNSQEFIDLGAADDEEHAILFCNFVRYLQPSYSVFLLLGRSAVHGDVALVLVRTEKGTFRIYDPSRGLQFSLDDPFCPLSRIDCIVSSEQILLNTQSDKKALSETNMDFENIRAWKPFFTEPEEERPKFVSAQPPELRYPMLTNVDAFAFELEDGLRNKIKRKYSRWRKHRRTHFNAMIASQLREVLVKLEALALKGRIKNDLKVENQVLQELQNNYNLSGACINLSYTDDETIIEAVKQLQIHQCDARTVEFAISIYAKPYLKNTISVWVYVAATVSVHDTSTPYVPSALSNLSSLTPNVDFTTY